MLWEARRSELTIQHGFRFVGRAEALGGRRSELTIQHGFRFVGRAEALEGPPERHDDCRWFSVRGTGRGFGPGGNRDVSPAGLPKPRPALQDEDR